MNILNASNVSKYYIDNTIFENIKITLNEGDKVGVVGRNGEGKTTLLNLLSGIELPNTGTISWKKHVSIGYLNQIPQYARDKKVYDCLKEVFHTTNMLSDKMTELEQRMAVNNDELEKLLTQYGKLQEQFEAHGGYEIEAQIRKVSDGLNIKQLLESNWGALSGGEKTKVGLAQILLQSTDLLLLDEPTNHLDIDSIEWLTEYVKNKNGAVVIISHDRYFLDETINHILEIDQQQLFSYHGNYSYFIEEREKRILAEFEAYQTQQKKINKMEQSIKQLRIWASQAKPPNAAMYKRAKSMEKALNRTKRLEKPILEADKMKFELHESKRVSNDVVELQHVAKMYNEILFEDINALVKRGQNVAMVGPNGSGKTTLIKIILGEVEPDEGVVKRADNLNIGYLSQNPFSQHFQETVLETFRELVNVTEGQARHILANFMFYGTDVYKRIKDLSGGEKMRLRWAQIVNQDFNVLILDEPTNHLDIDAKETIEEALVDFNGTIIAVSHDRYFLNKLFNITYVLDQKKLNKYEGNYSYTVEKRKDYK